MKISIDGIIGWDITAEDFSKKLPADGGDLEVEINSDGGDVIEAFAFYNMLKNYNGKVTAIINAKAMSAAAYIMFAAAEIKVYGNSVVMIHRAWRFCCGNAAEIRECAEVLEGLDKIMLADYAAATGQDTAAALAALEKDVWLIGAEAILAHGIKCEKIDYGKENKNTKIDEAQAKAQFKAAVEKIKALNGKPFNQKTLALLKNMPAGNAGKEGTMTKDELIKTLEADEELKTALLEWAKEQSDSSADEPDDDPAAAEDKPSADEPKKDPPADDKKKPPEANALAERKRCARIIALAGGKMTARAQKAIESGMSAADFMVEEAIAAGNAAARGESNADELGKPSVPKTFAELAGKKKDDGPQAVVTDDEKLRAMAKGGV
jgi:ATP-dependent protease ClpP protease subunit